jgi:hypothetical protein
MLAEAAPVPFVSALKALLQRTPEEVRALFLETVDFVTPVARHVELLWALETIAWEPNMLGDAVSLLAQLAAVDPGGKIGNRPRRSLREILLPWLPGTNAAVGKRIASMQAVAAIDERVGWDLAVSLLPSTHSVSNMTARPRYREAVARDEAPPPSEVFMGYEAAAALAVRLVGSDAERWATLIERFPCLPEKDLETACGHLARELEQRTEVDRFALWKCLSRFAEHQAELQDADWTLKGKNLARVQRLAADWAPADPLNAAAAAYVERWSRPGAGSPDDGAVEVNRRRTSALRRLLEEGGTAGVVHLVQSGAAGWHVAQDVAPLVGAQQALELCLAAIKAGGGGAMAFASTLSGVWSRRSPDLWPGLVAGARVAAGIDAASVVVLLLGFTDGPATWHFAEALGSDVRDAYWKTRTPWRSDADADDAMVRRPIEEYLRVGRGWSALIAIGEIRAPDPVLAFKALDAAVNELNSGEVSDGGMVQVYVERVFEKLRALPGVDEADLAKRELAYLPFLIGPGRERANLALFGILSREPQHFVGLLEVVFRAAGAEPKELDPQGKAMWHAAYNLLSAFKTVPGFDAGKADAKHLGSWVHQALQLSAASDRADIGASYVGKLLAHAPADNGGDLAWPAVEVRDLIEEIASEPLEQGLAVERFNMRGVYGKQIYEGGQQERQLAATVRAWQDACIAWPRTAGMLGLIAAEWESQADRADLKARQDLMRD